MKKRILSILLAMSLVLSLLPVTAQAATSGTCGDNLTWTLKDGVLTISGLGEMYNYLGQSAMPPWMNDNQFSITTVKIEDGVTSIGDWAFNGCERVTSVTIPNSVTSIGDYAFRYCSLTSVTIPYGVRSIGKDAFSSCKGLTRVTIPSSVTSIGERAFASCINLTRVTIPDSVTSMGFFAFTNCTGLTSATIGSGVTSIGSSGTSIGGYMFYGCSALTKVTIGNSVSSIGDYAFSGCSALTSVTIPNGITSIAQSVFYECSCLTSVTIPDSVASIGIFAFHNCSGLTDVYYGGSKNKWDTIPVEWGNDPLKSATIHYNSIGSDPAPGGESQKVPVQSTDEKAVLEAALSQMDFTTMFRDISLGMDKLRGPSISIAGETFYLFEIDSSLNLPFKKVPIQISADYEKKTVKVLLGFKEVKGGTTIIGDPNSGEDSRNDFWKSYTDAKDLMKTINGKVPNSAAFRSKFQDVYDELQELNMDLIVRASGRVSGYLELSYETGKLEFSEGGAILAVSVKSTQNGRIPSFPAAYVTLRFEVSAEGKIRLVADENSLTFDPTIDANLKAAIGLGLGKNTGKFQAYIEGGFDGNLGAHIRPMAPITGEDLLSVDMTGNLYLAWKLKATLPLWIWHPELETGDTYKKELFKFKLYPHLENLSGKNSKSLTMDDFLAEAEPVTREYLYAPALMDITDDYSFAKVEYPYAEPTLLRLEDGRLLMVWVGDDGLKTDADRTSIFYSVYSNGTWSDPAAIHESGTYADHPVLCQDGGNVYAVWMQADTRLEGLEAQEAFGHLDLMFSTFDGTSWSTPVRVSGANNGLAETDYVLAAKDGTVSVAWIENSENDMLMGSGTNTIYLRTYANSAWNGKAEIYSTSGQITGLDIDRGSGLQMTWSVSSGETTTAYRRDAEGNVQFSAGTDQDARWINGSLYELRDTELYRDGAATGLSGLTNYEIVSSGAQTAVLTLVPTGFTCELYGSYYDAGHESWGPWVQLTTFEKYIRSYSAVLDESGKLIAALNLVDTDADAERVYDNTSAMLVVVDDCGYTDLAVEDWLIYDDELVIPGGTLPLSFEAANNSLETLTSFTADISGQKQVVPCNLNAGESAIFTVNYQLPAVLGAHEVCLTVTPNYAAEESNTGNNSASVRIGHADLVTTISAPEVNNSGASIKICVGNEGYADAENAVLTVYRSNFEGELLCTVNLGSIKAGNAAEYTYQLPAELLFVNDPETMNALCCEVASDTEEWELANNSDRIVFDNLLPLQVSTTIGADSVKFSVLIKTGEDNPSNGLIVLALYGEDEKMLVVQTHALSIKAGENTTAEFTIDRSQNVNAVRAKVFWLGNQYAPVTQAWEGAYPAKS